MSYLPMRGTELIGRPGHSDLSGVWDTVKGSVSSALDYWGQTQQQKGASEALKEQNEQLARALAQQQGRGGGGGMPSWLPYALVGGGGLALVLLLRKRR